MASVDPGRDGKLPHGAADRVKEHVDLHALITGDGVALRREGREWVGCCPFHNEKSPSFKVSTVKAIFHCFGCGEGGDAIDWMVKRHKMEFAEAVRHLAGVAGVDLGDGPRASSGPPAGGKATRRILAVASDAPKREEEKGPRKPSPFDLRPGLDAECHAAIDQPDGQPVLDYLLSARRLSREAVDHFRLGALVLRRGDGSVRARYVSIPCYARDGSLLTVRFRSVPGPCLECGGEPRDDDQRCRACKGKGEVRKMFAHCPGVDLPLFNVGSLSPDTSAAVEITEGELDVIAGWDLGRRENIVSGTGGAGSFEDAWYDALEPYRSFVLLYDGDGPGDDGAKTVADRLGKYRCSRPTLPRKDLGDCLRDGVSAAEVDLAVRNARPMIATKIVSLSSFRDKIEARIAQPELLVGYPTGSARLDTILGGWRPGLVIVTGDSGSGKTSFTSWAIREQAMRGNHTLATCFEQSPEQLSEKFLRMQVGGDFTAVDVAARDRAWAELDHLPGKIHVVDLHGRMPKAELLDNLRYAVRRLDVRFAVVDHREYIDLEDDNETEITKFMTELSVMGVTEHITIVLICHPNRMNVAQQRRVGMRDLKGSSGIEQNAHVVLVVQRNQIGKASPTPSTTLFLDKVRSEFGTPDSSCVLAYDPLATSYADEWSRTPMGMKGAKTSSVVSPPPDAAGRASKTPTKRTRTVQVDEPSGYAPYEDGEVPA